MIFIRKNISIYFDLEMMQLEILTHLQRRNHSVEQRCQFFLNVSDRPFSCDDRVYPSLSRDHFLCGGDRDLFDPCHPRADRDPDLGLDHRDRAPSSSFRDPLSPSSFSFHDPSALSSPSTDLFDPVQLDPSCLVLRDPVALSVPFLDLCLYHDPYHDPAVFHCVRPPFDRVPGL